MEKSKSTTNFFSKPSLKEKKLASTSSQFNIKTIKFAELYKQIYSNQTGNAIKIIKNKTNDLRSRDQSLMKKTYIKSLNRLSRFHKSCDSKVFKQFNKTNTDNLAVDKNKKAQKNSHNMRISDTTEQEKDNGLFISQQKILNTTSRKFLVNKHINKNNTSIIETQSTQKFYCPVCEHCNVIKEPNLEKYLLYIKESKSIINKGFEYILNSNLIKNKTDIFSDFDLIDFTKNDEIQPSSDNLVKNNKKNFDMENLLSNFPNKIISHRLTLVVLNHFLDAIINEKLFLESVASQNLINKFNHSMISKGYSYEIKPNSNIEFDMEIDKLFDEGTKKILKEHIKKKFLNSSNVNKNEENQAQNDKRRFMILYLFNFLNCRVFLQILSDISIQCKERAILLYKIFKLYFVEHEKKWIAVIHRLKNKIKHYKDLCEVIVANKFKNVDKIDEINKVLLNRHLSEENLTFHKNIIHQLLQENNKKKDEFHLLMSEYEILEKEAKLWIYEFDSIKINPEIRKRLTSLDIKSIIYSVDDEFSKRTISRDEKYVLINLERFQIISGHRNMIIQQKQNFNNEIERLSQLYKTTYFKKREWKNKYLEKDNQINKMAIKYEKDIQFFRDRELVEKFHKEVQSDIDYYQMNKMNKTNDTVTYFKRLHQNKLANFIERIKYGCTKNKPILKKSLMFLIPEIYNEKMENDSKSDLEGSNKITFDVFFYQFFEVRFKIKKIINKHCEETVLAIINYSIEDPRIDLFRRFLGIGDLKLRSEILYLYLIIIKSLPISFFKLFDEFSTDSLTLTTDFCIEIYYNKLNEFNFVIDNRQELLGKTIFCINNKEQKIDDESKFYYFLINRFYTKSYIFISDLLFNYKNGQTVETMKKIFNQFSTVNKEFNISYGEFELIFERSFKVSQDCIDLESFFQFFHDKFSFEININYFLDISLNSIIALYDLLEKKILKYFSIADVAKREMITFKEFYDLMNQIVVNGTRWNISDYFNSALGGQKKDFLTKEEFITFCLKEKVVLNCLIKILKN